MTILSVPLGDRSYDVHIGTLTAEETAEQERDDQADEEELAVLQALERGEIGVDEAAARLERTGGSHHVR